MLFLFERKKNAHFRLSAFYFIFSTLDYNFKLVVRDVAAQTQSNFRLWHWKNCFRSTQRTIKIIFLLKKLTIKFYSENKIKNRKFLLHSAKLLTCLKLRTLNYLIRAIMTDNARVLKLRVTYIPGVRMRKNI